MLKNDKKVNYNTQKTTKTDLNAKKQLKKLTITLKI